MKTFSKLNKFVSLPRSDLQALYVTFGFLTITFVLHAFIYGSPMGLGETIWLKKLDLHLNWAPFAVRPLQSYATLALHSFLGLPVREAFFIIQFTLAAVLGFTFYRFLLLLDFGTKWSLIGLAMLMSAYPMFGAHFAPTHTWDDFWCYLSLVLMLTALIKNHAIRAGIFFLIACIARDQTVLFFPLLFLWYKPYVDRMSRKNFILTAIVPLFLFIIYRLVMWEDIDPARWQLFSYNFENGARTTDSVASLIISFGFIWILFIIGLLIGNNQNESKVMKTIRLSSLIVFALNTFATVFFSFIRETRILFPPFVLVIPVALIAARELFENALETMRSMKILFITAAILLYAAGYYLAKLVLFTQFDYIANSELRGPLAGIYLLINIVIFLFWSLPKIRAKFFLRSAN
jgi:hypothetical protein